METQVAGVRSISFISAVVKFTQIKNLIYFFDIPNLQASDVVRIAQLIKRWNVDSKVLRSAQACIPKMYAGVNLIFYATVFFCGNDDKNKLKISM